MDGCWYWTAARYASGYGRFRLGSMHDGTRRVATAHRLAYETMVGAVPAGLELDHLCRNRACVNPAHLEPVTRRENLLRGATIPAGNAAKTHCPKGHAYDARNTRTTKDGSRVCRRCVVRHVTERRERRGR